MWLLIYPAPDVPGQWVAHWLDNDLVSQGNDLRHAWMMALEAQGLLLGSYIARGQAPPMRAAPDGDWRRLADVLATGRHVLRVDDAPPDGVSALAASVGIRVESGNKPVVPVRWVTGAAELHTSAA